MVPYKFDIFDWIDNSEQPLDPRKCVLLIDIPGKSGPTELKDQLDSRSQLLRAGLERSCF